MDWYEGEINKTIETGRLPSEKLKVVSIEKEELTFNIEESNEKSSIEFIDDIFEYYKVYRKMIENIPEETDVNIVINTNSDIDDVIYNDEILDKAVALKPYVTELDRFLWYLIISLAGLYYQWDKLKVEETKNCLNRLIQILLDVEKKELDTGYTIKKKLFKSNKKIFDVINGDWNVEQKDFCKLKEKEKTELVKLFDCRKNLIEELVIDNDKAFEYATKTEKDWNTFIGIFNDLLEEEKRAVYAITLDISKYDKLDAIDKFNRIVINIMDGKYFFRDEEIDLNELLNRISERFRVSPQYCVVKTSSCEPFVLAPAIIGLIGNPLTFNYYLMMFHQLRLDPTEEVAKSFIMLSYCLICKNLHVEPKKYVSADETISDYYRIVKEYVEENNHLISKTKYKTIQNDAVSLPIVSKLRYAFDVYDKMSQKLIQKKMDEAPKYLSNEYIAEMKKDFETIKDFSEQEASVKQLVISINMIYLFARSIEIILGNKHFSLIEDEEQAKKLKNSLLKIETQLINAVYGDNIDKMYDYRDKEGVSTERLTQEEQFNDRMSNESFANILKYGIEEIINASQKNSIDEILMAKRKIIKSVSESPICYEKSLYADWLDKVVRDLCNRLVELCKSQSDNFDSYKNDLLKELGSKSSILPYKTIDSLITAEMLFDKYANMEFAEKGFDYSCVSTLYYQALETAYNEMIWKNYSKFLDDVVVEDYKLVGFGEDYFKNSSEAKKYLGSDYSQFVFYRDKKPNGFKKECMYQTFQILLDTAFNKNDAEYFLDYFADIAGFESAVSMKDDRKFMAICKDFISDFHASVKNRNKASHGGSIISLETCKEDKNNVLNNVDKVRKEGKGLIKQFIRILAFNE